MMIYSIQPGQTFTELSDIFHIENPGYLRDFHNEHCPSPERYTGDRIEGNRIFVPSAQEVIEMNLRIRDNKDSCYGFPEEGRYPFAYNLWSSIYRASHTVYFNDQCKDDYTYTIRLDFEEEKSGNRHFLCTVSDFRKNGESSDTKVSELSGRCIGMIYPVRLVTGPEGELLKVEYMGEPGSAEGKLEALQQYFPDPFSSEYIRSFKDTLAMPDEISRKFERTLFCAFAFGSFYRVKFGDWTHSPVYTAFYPWFSNAEPIRFELQNILCRKEHPEDLLIRIRQEGSSCDHRSAEELQGGAAYDPGCPVSPTSADCTHSAEYVFSRKTYSLLKVEAVFSHLIHGNTEKEVFILEKTEDFSNDRT